MKKLAAACWIAAVLTAGAMPAAHAENDSAHYTLGAATFQDQPFSATKSAAGLFTDTFTFDFASLPTSSHALALSGHSAWFGRPNIDFHRVTLNDHKGTVFNGFGFSSFLAIATGNVLTSPAYTLRVDGYAAAGASYGGVLTVLSMVPEPGTTWAGWRSRT